jgi:uncharacterized membrane protein YdfJ with MMPL/SSD domain
MSRAAWSEAPPTNISPPRRVRRPAVETIAGWSARHRKTAVFGWLALVAVAYLIGQLLGSPSLQQNDLGQAGQAEQTLQDLGVTTPTTEAVLVQERAPGRTFATDPAMRQAISQVTAALARVPGAATGISSPLSPGGQALVSANGRSALVTFRVPGPAANVNTAVTPALDAVAKVQASHPDLLVAEGGDARLAQAVNNQISSDLGKATETSLPLTLILLVCVFGALVAAGIPVLLALTSAVAGDTAANHDDASQLSARTPLVLAVVAAVAFCLLLLSFRSVVLPLVSIALNFLSVAAAYGLITVIFQDGRLQGLLGYASSGAITPWVPLFLFTFLFGISMDYHVFILSRIRELRRRGETTAGAVTAGIASSAGVVSSAALIMVAVFSIFIGMGQVELKMLGVGLAAAILLDATIVRGILLPAAMTLLGDRCWYLPRWLSWLPAAPP